MYQEGQATTAEVVLKSVHDEEMERKDRALVSAATERDRLRSNINAAKQVIIEAVEYDDLDREVAERIGNALGITLTTQVEYTLDVSLSITIDLPLGVDPDDIDESDFDVTLDYTGDGQMDYTQHQIDLTKD